MKMRFTLKDFTGSEILLAFRNGICEKEIGFDGISSISKAALSEDGLVWTTAMSGFTYTIVNPGLAPAVVEYNGAWRGFRAQNLIPRELRGATTHAKIVEGSVLQKHGLNQIEHADARVLADIYGMMQFVSAYNSALSICVVAAEARFAVESDLRRSGFTDDFVFVEETHADGGSVPGLHIHHSSPDGELSELVVNIYEDMTVDEVMTAVQTWIAQL